MKSSGTYNVCSNCKIEKNCCCNFEAIDNVIVTADEKENIVNKLGEFADLNFKKLSDKAYNIISVDSKCPFYKGKCTIYDIRPSDCRLFPYGILKSGDKYYLIKFDLPCGSKAVNENVDEIIDKIARKLFTIIDTYSRTDLGEKVSKIPYEIIKEIKF